MVSGKTTLMQAILGKQDLHGGEISLPNGTSIAYIEQTIHSIDEIAIYYVMRAQPICHAIYTQLQKAEQAQDQEKIGLLHAELSEIDGYRFKAEAEKILHGLGFTQEQTIKPMSEFSGGWQMRLHLAQCLLREADLLLLDEPTNHLDLEGIIWLQDWLQKYSGTLLLISHDRDFLDNVITQVIHIENKKLQLYTGNYSSFY